ncbi:sensor histidine kinase [Actinocrispum wychmicini]|uniref:histidine kinase n=1 Tax=Actinocrispum wychmicini TaxID=1213861 RepID=A0A4R2JJ85_9PSEU|nr:histidine kinase [Actinocrispum wychmicini]TCO54215.1 histidine kinase [Actinocrispum wychmicini]
MNNVVVLLLGGHQVLLGVTIWVSTICVRSAAAKATSMRHAAEKMRREHEFQVRVAITREHTHIARELHDVVAHHLTVIVAGASAAKRMSTSNGASETLGVIETVGRDALVEMRELLGRLHTDQVPAGPPRLDQLPDLVTRVGQAGLPVRLTVLGDRRPLPDDVEAHAYRIIQEALTNTLKHAGPTRAGVVVGYHPGWLRLRIHDEGHGHGRPWPGAGYGLVGMRQRAAQLGGVIAVGPGPDGGFQVAADLPVPAELRR